MYSMEFIYLLKLYKLYHQFIEMHQSNKILIYLQNHFFLISRATSELK